MAQTSKTRDKPLMPSPKALEKALAQSARQAQRLADAFGLKVPVTVGKSTQPPAKTAR